VLADRDRGVERLGAGFTAGWDRRDRGIRVFVTEECCEATTGDRAIDDRRLDTVKGGHPPFVRPARGEIADIDE
jgi:hypothetical protein